MPHAMDQYLVTTLSSHDIQEQALIETQLMLGMRLAVIAAGLMRAPSTILREIHRNG